MTNLYISNLNFCLKLIRKCFCVSGLALAFNNFTGVANSADITFSFSENYDAGYALKIRLSGEIKSGDHLKLEQALAAEKPLPNAYIQNRQLFIESPGGSLDEAIKVANLVRKRAVATYIGRDKQCLSACAIIFMAGADFDGDKFRLANRTLHPKGILGFHAPFAISKTDNIAPEVAKLLLRDAERGGAIAASKLVKLTLDNTLPASLVEELLKYEEDNFLYVDTIDKAGRWNIALEGERLLKSNSNEIDNLTRKKLSEHCNNQIHWSNDISFLNRQDEYELDDGELFFGGHDNGCDYKVSSGHRLYDDYFDYTVNQRFGKVKHWHTIDASTRLDSITSLQLTGKKDDIDPYANPPRPLISGNCKNGNKWVGGWDGNTYADSIAYAQIGSCDNTDVIFRLECLHEDNVVYTRISLAQLGHHGENYRRADILIDNKHSIPTAGYITKHRNTPELVSILTRGIFDLEKLMSGYKLDLVVDDKIKELHLVNSRETISAMLESCVKK